MNEEQIKQQGLLESRRNKCMENCLEMSGRLGTFSKTQSIH
jgi:hypothetical protein